MVRFAIPAAALCLLVAGPAAGEVVLLTQERFIEATTSFNEATQTIAAPDFGPFIEAIDLLVEFPAEGGGIGINRAFAGIDCDLDPNRIRVAGDVGGAGGFADVPGFPLELVDGNAKVFTMVLFSVDVNTAFALSALPRPSADPDDRFKLSLQRVDGAGETLFFIDEGDPAQEVFFTGELVPGVYEFEFEAELTVEGQEQFQAVAARLDLPAPGTAALGGLASLLLFRRTNPARRLRV